MKGTLMSNTLPTMQQLFEAGVHFGHQVRRWNPKMHEYIYGAKDGVHILDLAKTVEAMEKACDFVTQLAKDGKTILFLGTKKQAQDIIVEEAKRAGAYYISERWVGGLITNFDKVYQNIKRLTDLKSQKEKGEWDNKFTKKEQLLFDRQIEKLTRIYGGVETMDKLPDAIFIVDVKKEINATLESTKRNIPIIAICDTNADLSLVDYPIPGNDDAIKAIRIVTAAVADAYLKGKGKEVKALKENDVTKVMDETKTEDVVKVEPKESPKKEVKIKKEASKIP